MSTINETITTLKKVEKMLKEKGGINGIEPMEVWNSMGLFNPWYVINEKNNIIKFSWTKAFSVNTICLIVVWDKYYKSCRLLYCDTRIQDEIKILEINRDDIIKLEKYINENNYFNFIETEEHIQLDGSTSTLEIKIGNEYRMEDDCGYLKAKIIYNFANALFVLANENLEEVIGKLK